MTHKIFRSGNSLAVVIPSDFVHALGVKPGDYVKVSQLPESGKLTYIFSGAMQLSFSSEILRKKKKQA